ncbi:MAG: hypothetical protein B7C24_11520 [Bacteroidetes bacterium 4572_77]|nr:MAG: hypothetical protein B7C24_11520 [Bacteroidetes bacterium 4572_77]
MLHGEFLYGIFHHITSYHKQKKTIFVKPIYNAMMKNRMCEISKLEIREKEEWLINDTHSNYSIRVSVIGENIIHLTVSGYTTLRVRREVWPKVEQIIKKELVNKKCYLLHDYKDFQGGNSQSRFDYINWINNHIEEILGVYFYNVSARVSVYINAGKLFSSKLKNVFICADYKVTMAHLLAAKKSMVSRSNTILLEHTPDIFPKDWEVGKVIITKTNYRFLVVKKWTIKEKSYSVDTFLLEDNVILRIYKGHFKSENFELVASSFDDVLEECGLKEKRYHFYVDFSEVDTLGLGFRKAASKWYDMQESFSVDQTPSVDAYRHLKNLDKEQLIEMIKKKDKDHHAVIWDLYSKLGRISWDVNYKLDELESSANDNNLLTDVNDAIELIQSDVKELIENRDKLVVKAEESDRVKSAFLANMSHEIRTPMNAILGFSSVLMESGELSEDLLKYSKIIHRSSVYLISLINDIIDISKIESGQLDMSLGFIPLNALLQEVDDVVLAKRKSENNKQVTYMMTNTLIDDCVSIETDAVRLKQILFNIISNALKYTVKGSVNLVVKKKGDKLLFEVSDTGVGISPLDIPNLFKRFFRSLNVAKNIQYKGTGLGLAISKACVDMLGGELMVESKLNHGSVFSFSLPMEFKK